MKIIKPVGIIISIWFIAMGSLIGVHFFLKKKPQISRTVIEMSAKFKSLNDEEKIKIKYFESGIIKLANENLQIVGSGFEDEERDLITKKELSARKIAFLVDDPLLLERQMMINEAFKTLNNAEKRCVADHHAVIIYRDGSYYLLFDPKIYRGYALRYGTECEPCGDKKIKKE